MKILLVGDYAADPRLGSSKVYDKLRHELLATGHEVRVLLAPDLGSWPAGRYGRELLGPVLAWWAIRRAQKQTGGFDVVEVASAEGWLFGLIKKLGFYRSTRLIVRSHGLEHLNYERVLEDARLGIRAKAWWQRLWYPLVRMSQVKWAMRLADDIIVLNEGDAAYVRARFELAAERVHVVPHGLAEIFLEPGAAVARTGDILFCGSWAEVKGLHDLVQAFELLTAEGRSWKLTILGPGCEEALVRCYFSAAAQPHLHVLSRRSEAEVMEEYRRHKILVFCSTYEGFGMVVPEAMSQGLAVVATPVGCVPQLLRNGENGRVVALRQPQELARAVEEIMFHPEWRDQLGQQARQDVQAHTWKETARRTLAIYVNSSPGLRHGSKTNRPSCL